jgi:hypothetical protein
MSAAGHKIPNREDLKKMFHLTMREVIIEWLKPITDEEITNYRQIDATDFGDMENDPFVKKLMSLEVHHHH